MIPETSFKIAASLALVLGAFIAYANTLDGEWVWDDASSVLRHEHVQQPGKFLQLFREDQHPFGKGAGNFYRPLVAASFMLDYQLSFHPQQDAAGAPGGEVKPFLFHVSNILWHAAAAVLLLLLLLRLDAPRWTALLASLLFVVHPLHTEAVAYISGRADMMSAAFMFAGLSLALSEARAPRRYLAWGLSALCFIGGLLSKEATLIFPVLLALLLFLQPRPIGLGETVRSYYQRRSIPLMVSVVIVLVYAVLRSTVLRFGDEQVSTASPFLTRLVETGQAFAFYMQKLFVPTDLHMEQSLAGVPAWTSVVGWGLLLLVIAAMVIAWQRGQRRIVMGLAWFLAAWLPISGIFPLNAPMAEHWMYVPMAGFWWAVCEGLWLVAQRAAWRPAVTAAVTALCLVLLGCTVARNQAWDSNEALFRATLEENPHTLRVQYNLAVTFEDLVGNRPGAIRIFQGILQQYQAQKQEQSVSGDTEYLLDEEIEVRMSLGRLYLESGRFSEAAEQFSTLVSGLTEEEWHEVRAEAAMGLGRSLLALGDFPAAASVLGQAASMNPAYQAQLRALMLEGAPPAPIT